MSRREITFLTVMAAIGLVLTFLVCFTLWSWGQDSPQEDNTTNPTENTIYIEELCIDKEEDEMSYSTVPNSRIHIGGNLFFLECGHFSYVDYNIDEILVEIDPKAIDYYGLERFY